MKKTNMKNFLTLLMGIEDGEQMQITAAKTAYGDLVQQGIASVFSIL